MWRMNTSRTLPFLFSLACAAAAGLAIRSLLPAQDQLPGAVPGAFGVSADLISFKSPLSPEEPAADDKEPSRFPAVAEAMGELVKSEEIAGAVTLVASPDRVLHLDATGWRDTARHEPMRADTIFWIASMTKPVTATAVLMLEDDRKLSVDDRVEKYIPELANLRTSNGQPAKVTIRHLLTHTSGMAEITPEEAKSVTNLAGLIPLYAARPLAFEPGERWAYCQSGINTAARVVEVVSGKSFVDFLAERLFRPLGMKDTTFYLYPEQAGRLAKSYSRTPAGKLEEAENFILLGKSPTSHDRFPAANGGLFSTASDHCR